MTECLHCLKRHSRASFFCSRACGEKDRRLRKEGVVKREPMGRLGSTYRGRHPFRCANPACGKESVGNKGRLFCSRRCFERNRYLAVLKPKREALKTLV